MAPGPFNVQSQTTRGSYFINWEVNLVHYIQDYKGISGVSAVY